MINFTIEIIKKYVKIVNKLLLLLSAVSAEKIDHTWTKIPILPKTETFSFIFLWRKAYFLFAFVKGVMKLPFKLMILRGANLSLFLMI